MLTSFSSSASSPVQSAGRNIIHHAVMVLVFGSRKLLTTSFLCYLGVGECMYDPVLLLVYLYE
jgi:hypothetical protein